MAERFDGRRLFVELADTLTHIAEPLEIGLARFAAPADPPARLVLLGAQVVALVDDGGGTGQLRLAEDEGEDRDEEIDVVIAHADRHEPQHHSFRA